MESMTIRELEQFSGVSPHTIRIWEKRYGVFSPARTQTNYRLYNLCDLQKLFALQFLTSRGHRISTIAQYRAEELLLRLEDFESPEDLIEIALHRLLMAKLHVNPAELNRQLDACVDRWGIHTTIEELLVPFLEKTGLLSYKDRGSAAHFAVTNIRRKLILGIETGKFAQTKTESVLLFLPDAEHFDLVLIYLDYRLRQAGFQTHYMGTNVPMGHLLQAIDSLQPDHLVTYFTEMFEPRMEKLAAGVRPYRSRLWLAMPSGHDNCALSGGTTVLPFRKLVSTLTQASW